MKSYGLQDDPAQAHSQWAPRPRKNALAAQAVDGALSKSPPAWTDAALPRPAAPSSAALARRRQQMTPALKANLPEPERDPLENESSSAASRLTSGGTRPSAADTAARHYGLSSPGRTSSSTGGGGSILDTDEGGDDLITIPPGEKPPGSTPLPPVSSDDPEPWTPPMASLDPESSTRAPRIVVEGGKTYLTEHGRRRLLTSPEEIQAAQGYVTDFWTKYPTGFQEGVGPQSNDEYAELTGLEGVDQSGWDTDSYSKPGYIATEYGGTPAGWDATNWSDPNMQTPKYVVGRILSNYDLNDQAQVEEAVALIQKAYPGTTYDGKDKVTIPGVGTIDFIQAYGGGNALPTWLPQGAGGGASGGGGGGGGSTFTANQQMGGDATSILAQILPGLLAELGLGSLK